MKRVAFGRRNAVLRLVVAACSLALLALGTLDHGAAQQETVSIDITESIGVSDSQQALPPASADMSESLSVADSVAVVPPVSIEVTESVLVADSQQAVPPASVDANEGVQVTDTVLVLPPASIVINETIAVSDTLGDSDGDGTPDLNDNCAVSSNGNQEDADSDTVGSACDNCPATPNGPAQRFVLWVGYQTDSDSDAQPGIQPPSGGIFGGDACDVDDDNDGVADIYDVFCRTLPEDYDGFQDNDGCPDLDDDSDNIPDTSDMGKMCFDPAGTLTCSTISCRLAAEDVDAFKDTDGCPEPDNDNDSFPDATDACPGADASVGTDGMFGAPQDLNHNGVRDGIEAAFTTDDVMPLLMWEDKDGVLDTDGCHDSPGDDFDGDGFTDDAEVFTHLTDAGNPDTDADTVVDGTDNCPNWPNATQTLPPWAVPANDSDCDGFTVAREQFVGTDPTKHCNNTTTANDEPDNWPSDFNDSRTTNLSDVILMGPSYNKSLGNPAYNARFDLNASNSVNLSDVILLGLFYNKSCA